MKNIKLYPPSYCHTSGHILYIYDSYIIDYYNNIYFLIYNVIIDERSSCARVE